MTADMTDAMTNARAGEASEAGIAYVPSLAYKEDRCVEGR